MKVHILANDNFVSYYFFYPLLVNRRRLSELGLEVKFFEKEEEKLWNSDVVILDSKCFHYWEDKDSILEMLSEKRRSTGKLVWLDSSASSGVTFFPVLPFVDGYWKKQVLKDLSSYKKVFAGSRIYTDYYCEKFGVKVENYYPPDPLQEKFKHKISVSWNLGVGPYGRHNQLSNFMRKVPWWIKNKIPFWYPEKFIPSRSFRKQAIAFRGAKKYSNSAIDYQRQRVLEKLETRGLDTKPVPYSDYWKELETSELAVSPFGFGEICYRDFEVFVSGATLVKPSMEHMRTYPDLFVKDKTYCSISWDLSDFDFKIDELLANPKLREYIGETGQNTYKKFVSSSGQEEFCQRFFNLCVGLK